MQQQTFKTCEAIAQTLEARGFLTQTIAHYWRYWDKLIQYLSDNVVATYTPKAGLDFLLDVYGITARTGLTREQCGLSAPCSI